MSRYERLLREVHIAGLELTLDLRKAQQDASQGPLFAHQLFARFDAAQAGLTGVIADVAMAHAQINRAAAAIGIDPTAYGEPCPPEKRLGNHGQLSDLAQAR